MATTTLDNLISESGRRTGIGAAAEPLTRELLRFMLGGPGGLTAFLDRFRNAGLGGEIASFLGGRSETPLPARTVDTVIGENTVEGMARKAGVEHAAASAALGYEIPKLIGMLTPDGKVPSALATEIQGFVGPSEQVSPLAMASIRDEAEQVAPAAMATIREPKKANLAWLYGLLALLVLAGLLWMLLSRSNVQAPQVAVTTPAVTVPTVKAPAIPAVPAPVTETVTALNADLNRTVLNFATASAVLPDASSTPLQTAADRIKGLPAGTRIEVGGHTDNTGSAAANMALSQRRADAVRNALIQDGVDSAMLTTKGYGETKPIASNDTPEGRLQNRRTEFTVAGAETTTTTTTVKANP
jgi:outer membrane protein OmpA-like peptidoglycan-associated protein/uncharacterized protein YidB (DUF937 family)